MQTCISTRYEDMYLSKIMELQYLHKFWMKSMYLCKGYFTRVNNLGDWPRPGGIMKDKEGLDASHPQLITARTEQCISLMY